jgi:nucleoside-diphosphate-sugar epimerase
LKNEKIKSGIYNAGFENLSIINIAKKISKICDCKLKIIKKFNDQRSYRQNSDKLISTGFKRKYSIDDAINELSTKIKNKILIPNDTCFTVKFMKKKGFR